MSRLVCIVVVVLCVLLSSYVYLLYYVCTVVFTLDARLLAMWASSSVGIATDYGLDGPGSNPGGDEIFRPSRPALGPAQPPVQWVPGLSWG